MSRLELTFEAKGVPLSVRRFVVREALSSPFSIRVFARSNSDDLDLDAYVGHKAGFLMMGAAMASPRAWSGVVKQMEQTEVEPTGLSTYFIEIVPTLWLTTRRTQNRIFQHRSLPAIVEEMLREHGIEVELRLAEPHPEHEYRVQFGETDFHFLSRLLEEEGISYAFEQVAEGDGWVTRMVLRDRPQAASPRAAPLRYVDAPSHAAREELVTAVRVMQAVRPAALALRDYDFTRPDLTLLARDQAGSEAFLEQYAYAPSLLVKDRQGKPRAPGVEETRAAAAVSLEAFRSSRRLVAFQSNAFDLAPGAVFAIDRHPRRDLGVQKQLLATECVAEGTHDGAWTLEGVAAFAALPWRPERRSAKPVMAGVQSAFVVGTPGEEIHTDELGRVRVQFHWDREGENDERSSCWIRVAHGWAGPAFGMHTLPRAGQEVIVDFFDGDPDAPIVVGRAFNARTRTPYALPAQAATSAWKSSSSPGGDGWNEVLLDDRADKELVFVQAQRDLSKLVKADEMARVGNVHTAIVGKGRSAVIGGADTTLVGTKSTIAMADVKDLHIRELGDPEVVAKSTLVEMIEGKLALATGRAFAVLEGANLTLAADGDLAIKSGGDVVIRGGPKVKINCQDVSGQMPAADAKVADGASKPTGRILGAIQQLFGSKKEAPPPAAPERKELVVPHRVQVGGTCGLAALGMVMDYWKAKDPKAKAPPDTELLAKAKEKKWTETGGMYESDEAKLAQEYGYDATYKRNASMADIKQSVDAGVPPLVTFSVDGAGEPKTGTDWGHYAVIKGYFTKDGKDYLVAQHGWGGADNKVWEQKAFEDSWKALNHGSSPMVAVKPK